MCAKNMQRTHTYTYTYTHTYIDVYTSYVAEVFVFFNVFVGVVDSKHLFHRINVIIIIIIIIFIVIIIICTHSIAL